MFCDHVVFFVPEAGVAVMSSIGNNSWDYNRNGQPGGEGYRQVGSRK